MGRRRQQSGSRAALLLFLLLVAVLVIGGIYFAMRLSHEEGAPREAATQAGGGSVAENAEPLITDDRILFGGAPRGKRPDVTFTTLKNIAYMVGYSEERKDPLWSAYRVIHMEHPYVLKRPTGEFLTDNRTVARVSHHDFTGSGYDRGHMTPNSAIAHCYGSAAQLETFLLSNICPQSSALNEKVWEKLEKEEFVYADEFGEVWVMDGPIFGEAGPGDEGRKLRTGIAVPESFYKILIEEEGGTVRVFSVIMPQRVKGTELPQQYLTSIDTIEEETHLEFLWKLPAGVQRALKGSVQPMW